MRKLIFSMLLMLIGLNCFAQTIDAKSRALQGEWVLISYKEKGGKEEKPQGKEELVYKFDGDKLFMVITDDDGKMQSYSGTFTVVGNFIIISVYGETGSIPYTVKGNTMTMNSDDDAVATFHRR